MSCLSWTSHSWNWPPGSTLTAGLFIFQKSSLIQAFSLLTFPKSSLRSSSKSEGCREAASMHKTLQIAHCHISAHLGLTPRCTTYSAWQIGKTYWRKKDFKDTCLASTQMCLIRYPKLRLGIYKQIWHLKTPTSVKNSQMKIHLWEKSKAMVLHK